MIRFIFILIIIFSFALLQADIVETVVHFNSPKIIKTEKNAKIEFSNCLNQGKVGEPTLPYYGLKMLLPLDHVVKNVKIEKEGFVKIEGNYNLQPYQPQYPLSDKNNYQPIPPDTNIYSKEKTYPSQLVKNILTNYLAGYSIATAAITPVQYIPSQGKLGYYSKLKVIIETIPARNRTDVKVNTSDKIVNFVTNNVENPNFINTYPLRNDRDEIDILIIAAEDKLEFWQEYADIYINMDYNVVINTVEDIENEVTGNDLQEKIRRYIKNMYNEYDVFHVLLAGDTDVIPERGFSVDMGNQVDNNIPADMYYSCLDGTWNTDNDDNWGEPIEADLAPELSIGRFCYNNEVEIENFIHKVNSYWHSPIPSEVTTSLFVGEWLWNGPTWGGDYMDELIGECDTNGHETNGIPNEWQISKLYERDMDWGAGNILSELSNGPNLVNHLGHSNVSYNMKLYTNQVNDNGITNDGENHGYSIHFSQGCYAGSFDNRSSEGYYGSDCITEKFTSISNSAVSMISHSRYGWGQQGSTNGASQFFHREWVDAIFSENIVELGYTLVDSKLDAIPFIDSPVMYWVTYETNLIGDPALKIRTQSPEAIEVTHLDEIEIGTQQLEIETNIDNGNIVLTQYEEVLALGSTGFYGQTTIQLEEPIQSTQPLYLQISKYNYQTYEATIQVVNSESPYVVCQQPEYTENGDYNDGYLQSNDIIDISLTFQNYGNNSIAGQAVASLSSENNLISILQGEVILEEIEPNSTFTMEEIFQIKVEPGVVEDQNIELQVDINYETEIWTTYLQLPLVAPHILYIEPLISITSGEDNQLNPGETAELYLIYENNGSGVSYELNTTIFSIDPNITATGTDIIPNVNPGEQVTTWQPIQLTVSEDCPIDYVASLDLMAYDNIGAYVFDTINLEITENVSNEQQLPLQTSIGNNYPNPFNPKTQIDYSINKNTVVKIQLFNIKGELVKTLINEEKPAGTHQVVWYGKDETGKEVASGVYFYKMQTEDYNKIKRMLLLK
ncbi:MAG: C25 family cysteine peptidase [Candidatus Cloacimonadota bacterium]|nr:C25 family cysteine peptidase [Candidatus Cloacimonadota bacterium]